MNDDPILQYHKKTGDLSRSTALTQLTHTVGVSMDSLTPPDYNKMGGSRNQDPENPDFKF